MDNWYRLDNAAKIFPAVTKKSNTSVYRVAVRLKENVDPERLQSAAEMALKRYPLLAVKLRRGVFWNFFDKNESPILIAEEMNYPCSPLVPKQNRGYFLRVLYYKQQISLEVFHALTDGTGAIEFLKTLLYQYFRLKGKEIDPQGIVLLPGQVPEQSELDDSFRKYYKPVKKVRVKRQPSFRIVGTPLEPFGNNIVHGVFPAKALNSHAKSKGATLTEYLTACLIYAIYLSYLQYGLQKEPVVISVPVNLRKLFPSKTLRNFFAVANIGATVDAEIGFDALLKRVSKEMKAKTSKEALQEIISDNVHLERNYGVKFVPLFLKNIVLKQAFNIQGENLKTITISNLGNIRFPADMAGEIEEVSVILYPTVKSPVNCGMCTFGDRLNISFARTIRESDMIFRFFKLIAEDSGLEPEIYSNDWGFGK